MSGPCKIIHSRKCIEFAVIREPISLKRYGTRLAAMYSIYPISPNNVWTWEINFYYCSHEFLFNRRYFFLGTSDCCLAILPYSMGVLWMWSLTAIAGEQRQPWLQFHAAGCYFLLVLLWWMAALTK